MHSEGEFMIINSQLVKVLLDDRGAVLVAHNFANSIFISNPGDFSANVLVTQRCLLRSRPTRHPVDDNRSIGRLVQDGQGNLRHLLVEHKIELLDNPVLLQQLRALEERHTRNGNIDIRPSYSQKDDVAVAVALGAFELAKRPPQKEPLIEVITIPRRPSALAYQGSLERGWIRIGY
jgi:hypothetical protein